MSKLKENNRRVIGCGVKSSTSDLLIANCDEFIYYDDLIRAAKKAPSRQEGRQPKRRTRSRRPSTGCWRSSTRSSRTTIRCGARCSSRRIRRVYPGFNEGYYGYGSFSDLLEDIKAEGLIELEYDDSRGNYKVRRSKK